MSASDMEILQRAYDREHDARRPVQMRAWEYFAVGATRKDINRLFEENLVEIIFQNSTLTKYKLTKKGNDLVWANNMEHSWSKVPAASIMEAMDLIVGFQDIKESIAMAIEERRKINFLLEGPPACAKSLILDGVRSAVPGAYLIFGSRTSGAGLSNALFEHKPSILLMDEVDKVEHDCLSVLLGLLESGEVIETLSHKERGIKLNTIVIAAGNDTSKMPPEFLSRFSLHVHFPVYTREAFIDVCCGFLSRAEGCPHEIAELIGRSVYDNHLGDVRKARGVWQLMTVPTEFEVERVVQLMIKYSPQANGKKLKSSSAAPKLL